MNRRDIIKTIREKMPASVTAAEDEPARGVDPDAAVRFDGRGTDMARNQEPNQSRGRKK